MYGTEPRFNEPLFNKLLGIMNNIFWPGKSNSKMYGTEPRFNEPLFNKLLGTMNNIFWPSKSNSKMYGTEPRFNKFLDLKNQFQQPKLKIYLKCTLVYRTEVKSSDEYCCRHSHRPIKVRKVNSYIIQSLAFSLA